jgi:CRP-like cAMP-binding protein
MRPPSSSRGEDMASSVIPNEIRPNYIAYLSMEVGLDSGMPTYSGGLGVLAGDTLRAAADLGLPMVGITLLHRKGYFRQALDSDSALEWCETRLILEEDPKGTRNNHQLPVAAMDIVANLRTREISLLESVLEIRNCEAGEKIIRESQSADSLFLLASGSVSVYLKLKNGGRAKRLSSLSPGLAFGELSPLDGGVRSAEVVAADEPVVCYVLSIEKLNALAIEHPAIKNKLIFNIAKQLSTRLRRADAEIRTLAE